MPEYLKVLELFSGIGGMHAALKLSEVPGDVCVAVDINSVANDVYEHNFPGVKVLRKNIQKLSSDYINKLGVNTILMSPPCQPFTRVGNKLDVADNRSSPLLHIIGILPELAKVRYLLLENVAGFEESEACQQLRKAVRSAGFNLQESLISPLQLGIPNSRQRYYMIASRTPFHFKNEVSTSEQVVTLLKAAHSHQTPSKVSDVLALADDSDTYNDHLVPDAVLTRHGWILDIVTKNSTKTCCFTKSYTHYVEGTGSVYCPLDESTVRLVYDAIKSEDGSSGSSDLKSLRLRFFTPPEVQRLLCFPNSFTYPPQITKRQKYRLLGNSINVDVVSRLIRIMVTQKEEFKCI